MNWIHTKVLQKNELKINLYLWKYEYSEKHLNFSFWYSKYLRKIDKEFDEGLQVRFLFPFELTLTKPFVNSFNVFCKRKNLRVYLLVTSYLRESVK